MTTEDWDDDFEVPVDCPSEPKEVSRGTQGFRGVGHRGRRNNDRRNNKDGGSREHKRHHEDGGSREHKRHHEDGGSREHKRHHEDGGSREHKRHHEDGGSREHRRHRENGGGDQANQSPYADQDAESTKQDELTESDEGISSAEHSSHEEKPAKKKSWYIPAELEGEELFGTTIASGVNFTNYDKMPVKVIGHQPPPAIARFEDCNFPALLMDNIMRSEYRTPTPIQKYGIPIVLAGRDLMGCAQSGSGKTAAFLLPIISSLLQMDAPMSIGRPHALIVSPTRELAVQTYNESKRFTHGSHLKTAILYGGTDVAHQLKMFASGAHIVVAAPGRLSQFVDSAFLTLEDIKYIVFDEGDRLFSEGFEKVMEDLMQNPTLPTADKRSVMMFSATFPEEIQLAASRFLQDSVFLSVGLVGSVCSDIEQIFFKYSKYDKRQGLLDLLGEDEVGGSLVFVNTKLGADFLASYLSETMIPTTSIHGDREQDQREEALRDFKTNKMRILVATDVVGRGIDIKEVRRVINYDMPKNVDDYVHRIGRTGRVGNPGKAINFYDEKTDSHLAADLVAILKQAGQDVPYFLVPQQTVEEEENDQVEDAEVKSDSENNEDESSEEDETGDDISTSSESGTSEESESEKSVESESESEKSVESESESEESESESEESESESSETESSD